MRTRRSARALLLRTSLQSRLWLRPSVPCTHPVVWCAADADCVRVFCARACVGRYNSQLQKQVTLMSDARGGDISGRRSELEMAQEHLRKLKSENAALRDAMERSEQQRKAAAQQQDDGQTAATKSAVCLIS